MGQNSIVDPLRLEQEMETGMALEIEERWVLVKQCASITSRFPGAIRIQIPLTGSKWKIWRSWRTFTSTHRTTRFYFWQTTLQILRKRYGSAYVAATACTSMVSRHWVATARWTGSATTASSGVWHVCTACALSPQRSPTALPAQCATAKRDGRGHCATLRAPRATMTTLHASPTTLLESPRVCASQGGGELIASTRAPPATIPVRPVARTRFTGSLQGPPPSVDASIPY
mmetsp:Transcript_7017/g.17442  ORF Transcript_7017/g.17442 Transcript_7017/m.17442 type:complete len:230 (+) Transcript_7017:229-918(+)